MAADYKVLTSNDAGELEKKVNGQLALGYVLHGGLQVSVSPIPPLAGVPQMPKTFYHQAIVKG